jgi:GNAT superfamily N-acetyltransferase
LDASPSSRATATPAAETTAPEPAHPSEGAGAARRSDLSRLEELYAEAIEALASARGGEQLLAEQGRPSLAVRGEAPGLGPVARLLGEPSACVEAGWFGGALVGIGIAHVAPGSEAGVVSTLYVGPEARGVGVGEAVLAALVDWCHARGCTGVDVTALPGDRATKSLLERAGFAARAIVMRRALEG